MSIKTRSATSNKASDIQDALDRVLKSLVFHEGPPPWLAELPVSQLRCWFKIAENEGLRMHDLADSMGVKLPAVSHIVDRLVRRGLVERQTDPLDRRAGCLYFSEDTRARYLEFKSAHLARVAEASSKMSTGNLEALICGLNELADAAVAMNAAARPGMYAGRAAGRRQIGVPRPAETGRRITRHYVSPKIKEPVK